MVSLCFCLISSTSIKVEEANCGHLQESIYQAFQGPHTPGRLAITGNADASQPGEWNSILTQRCTMQVIQCKGSKFHMCISCIGHATISERWSGIVCWVGFSPVQWKSLFSWTKSACSVSFCFLQGSSRSLIFCNRALLICDELLDVFLFMYCSSLGCSCSNM